MKAYLYSRGVLYEDDAANKLVALCDCLLRIVVPVDCLPWNLHNHTLNNHCHTFSFFIHFMSMQLSIQLAASCLRPLMNLSRRTRGARLQFKNPGSRKSFMTSLF